MSAKSRSPALQTEIAELQAIYGALCRLESNAAPVKGDKGETTDKKYVMKVVIRKKDQSLNVTFLIPAEYPDHIPDMYASTALLGPTDRDKLVCHLSACAHKLLGTPMMACLVEEAYQWCVENKIHTGPMN